MQWAYEQWGDNLYADLKAFKKPIEAYLEREEIHLPPPKRKALLDPMVWQTQMALMETGEILMADVGQVLFMDFNQFTKEVDQALKSNCIKLSTGGKNQILNTVSWRDKAAARVIKKVHGLKGEKLDRLLHELNTNKANLCDYGYWPGGKAGKWVEELEALSKAELIKIILDQREMFYARIDEKEKRINELTEQLAGLNRQRDEQKNKEINRHVNEPSSKKPEWDKDGNPKKKRKKKRKKRPGCGNVKKTDMEPEEVHHIPLDCCPDCGTDLSDRKGRENSGRIVEDIAPPEDKTILSKEIEESKWCPRCKKTVSSKTEKALPGSDIGLNATIEMAYLWVMSALSLPKIQALVQSFKALPISTAGISKIMIRLSGILQPVYDEILADVQQGARLWADETGWRVKGKLWWLWIFANERSAYYWADKTRGSSVVERLLGEVFYGILIVDGWHAYTKIVCAKQTCMAHIFRKIRAFIDAYPQYRSIMTFYLKLRRIIRDGEKLQKQRSELDEMAFQRRLKALRHKLDELLRWKNPNAILRDVIKKVLRQKERILTFVEHDGATHHNNYGEYIIKKGVVKRKMSGGSMSKDGARAYACIQSIAMTCQLRNMSFHGFLKASLVQYIRTGKPMLLAEYEDGGTEVIDKMAA